MKLFELNKFFGKRGTYKEPTKEEIELLKQLVEKLFLGKESLEQLASKLKLSVVELEDKPNNYAFFNKRVGPIFFVWNFNEINSGSCLAYPHAGSDGVNKFVLNQYLSGNHKCMVINGWSITSTKKKSLTSNRTKSNVDHSYENLMNHFIHFVNLQDPELVFINVHGMKTDPNRNTWVINSMSRYDYGIKNYPVLLLIAFLLHSKIKVQTNVELDRFALNGKPINLIGFNKVGPTSSVIGRIIHSQSMDPKSPIRDTGNFVHMENSISFASKKENSDNIANIHKIALNYYKTWNNDKHLLKNAPKELENFESWLFKKDN